MRFPCEVIASAAHRVTDRRGAAAVEFAMVFPFLLVLLLGIFEFGRLWSVNQVVTDAAREGARRAVVKDGLNGPAKRTAVNTAIDQRLSSAGLQWSGTPLGDPMTACPVDGTWSPPNPPGNAISVAGCGWGGTVGTPARVVIRTPFPFQFLRPVMRLSGGGSGPGPLLLRSDFSMRNE
jgi:Flp pilus assembly protein TadG